MKKVKIPSKIIAIVLCFISVFCMFFTTSCGNNKNLKVIDNGQSDYKIVVSDGASNYVRTAAAEIQYFLKESSGYNMEIISDANIEIIKDAKYISVGTNAITEHFKFKVSKDKVGTRGFCIKTKNNIVMINGATELGYGTLYGAYEFLSRAVDYECYDPYFGTYVAEMKTVEVPKLNITDKPDIEYSMYPSGRAEQEQTLAHRMRMEGYTDVLMTDYGTVHNDFSYLPPKEYLNEHPKWYNDPTSPKQLCYTAHGDANEYSLMLETISDKMIQMLDKYPEYVNMAFTEQDVQSWCSCETCTAEKNKYGGNSAVCVKLCNDLAKRIEQHYKDLDQEREFYIYFFVYMQTEDVPANKVKNKYVPVDDSVRCNSHVVPYIGTMYRQHRKLDFYSEANASAAKLIEGWSSLADHVAVWTYCTCFADYLFPYNSVSCIPNNLEFFKKNKTVMYINNSAYITTETGFGSLKRFLTYKYAWKTDSDYNTLIDDYFENYYGFAGDVMKKFFNDWMIVTQRDNGRGGDIVTCTKEMYPFAILKRWIDYLDEAVEIIEKNYTGKKAENYINAIDTEKVSVYYTMLQFHSDMYSPTDLLNFRKEFKRICEKVGIYYISQTGEGTPLSGLYSQWGI